MPEPLYAVDVGVVELHVGSELIGKTADLTAAHGVRLAGQRERPHARLADAAGRKVAVDDGVDLVGALRRLVDALRVAGDDLGGPAEQVAEAREVFGDDAACLGGGDDVRRDLSRARQRVLEPGRVAVDISEVDGERVGEVCQQR